MQVSTKKYRKKKIYMMHEQFKCHDACSNALKLSSNSQNWLEHRVSNKNPKNLKNHSFNLYKIDHLINYINSSSQFYQFGPN